MQKTHLVRECGGSGKGQGSETAICSSRLLQKTGDCYGKVVNLSIGVPKFVEDCGLFHSALGMPPVSKPPSRIMSAAAVVPTL